MRLTLTKAAPTALIVLAGLVLTGCGNDSSGGSMPGMNHGSPTTSSSTPSTSATPSSHNEADVRFASDMIPHHQQAIEMADLALRRAQTAEVKKLATAIKAAQDPEIKQLSAWLTSWGQPVPTPGGHQGHGATPMPGMMTEQEMTDLRKAPGTLFDRMWVQLMIRHHRGAVTMAKAEQTTGKNPAAITLAKKVETDQTREISTMQRLLGQLPVS